MLGLREMHRIEEVALGIEPGAELHEVAPLGLHGLVGHEVAHHAHGAPLVGQQIGRHHVAAVVAPRQIEERARYGEADELHRSEEHTSELQSLRRISYAVFSLKKNT